MNKFDVSETEQPPAGGRHEPATVELQSLFENDPQLRALMEKSIAKAVQTNPDKISNPVQTLDELYSFLDWAVKSMPWNVIAYGGNPHASFFDQIDSAMNYFYFLFDQPLDELKGAGLYNNTMQYLMPIYKWITSFVKQWGSYLSTPDSWKPEYEANCFAEPKFGLQNGWYEDASNWHTFNEFFARKLKDKTQRPIASPENNRVVVAPADSCPRGVWKIGGGLDIVSEDGVTIKSSKYSSLKTMLRDTEGHLSPYVDYFAGGTLTHTYLNEGDYHRYHFPFSGKILEARIIEYGATGGGIQRWDKEQQLYLLDDKEPGWQALETRGLAVLDTEFGIAAVMPIGMAQVGSVLFRENIKAGTYVKKGDELGNFLFGGSDTVMLFQNGVNFQMTHKPMEHILMGEEYGRIL